jgi:hypothetical protein
MTYMSIGAILAINPAFATRDAGSSVLERVDENVYENAILNDIPFHEGSCQDGHSTVVLDSVGGCENGPITAPGNSDDNRRD